MVIGKSTARIQTNHETSTALNDTPSEAAVFTTRKRQLAAPTGQAARRPRLQLFYHLNDLLQRPTGFFVADHIRRHKVHDIPKRPQQQASFQELC